MGRWMQKIQKPQEGTPTKPTEPGFVGSVGTACPPFQKKQAVNDPLNSEQIGWLSAVAKLLEVGTMHLLESGFIDRHDLEEQLGADPEKVAALIRSNPFWHRRANDETRRHK